MRDLAFLTAQRARAWCIILAAMTGLLAAGYLLASHGAADPTGKPLGTDFVSFYAASKLALAGQPEAAYAPARHLAAEEAALPFIRGQGGYAAFFYPPTYLLLCLPLALVPYLGALAAWLAAGFALMLAGLRRLLPARWALLPMISFPAVILNAGHGQNAFFSTACFAWAASLAERRPALAGAALGLLAFKPHLLIAAPLILLAGRRWCMLGGLVAAASCFALAALLAFGAQTWQAFLANAELARATLTQGLVDPAKMQSVYAALRVLHAPAGAAYAIQAIATAAVLLLALRAAIRRPGPKWDVVLAACATLLCTPFLLDYDLAIAAVPLAAIAAVASVDGWRPWEKLILFSAFVLPLLARTLAMQFGLPVAPLVLAALFAACLRRMERPDARGLNAKAAEPALHASV